MLGLLLVVNALAASPADVWPAFRGSGDSVSQASRLPLTWSRDKSIAWTANLTGTGQSGPIIWRERVFVTSAEGRNKEQAVLTCYELTGGRQLWQHKSESSQLGPVTDYTSCAAPTPAADDRHVYAFFETGNLIALKHDGTVAWQRSLTEDYGKFAGNHGVGSSIALTADAVLVLVDHDGPSYLLAADKQSGKTLWKQEREQKVSWSSPIVDGNQIIVSSNGACQALDAHNGEKIWSIDGLQGNTVPSATVTEKLVVVGSSELGSNLAIRRDGQGDVTQSHIAWRSDEASATFSSPLVYQGHVYLVNRAGVAFCLDQSTGNIVWKKRLGGSCWASPLGACDRVYFFEKSGATTVVAAGPELKILAENSLPTEDRVYGVAAVDGKIVVRTGSKLICIQSDSTGEQPVAKASDSSQATEPARRFPDMPQAVTSFGATILDGAIYTYGGHHGTAHHYNDEGQSGELLRLNLGEPKPWETMATGPRLQGLALVSHGGMLYRIGGFEARNKKGEEQNLWSLADFTSFDPAKREWKSLAPMPLPRSSFDAAVSGDTVVVGGGWSMQGDKPNVWQDTAYAFDFSNSGVGWRELPKPGFQRRALAVGAVRQKVFVIGGMQPDGKVTRRTAIFDLAGQQWTDGPELPGE